MRTLNLLALLAFAGTAALAQMPGQQFPAQPPVRVTQSATGFDATIGTETMRVTVCADTVIHVVTRPQGGDAKPAQPWLLPTAESCTGAQFQFNQDAKRAMLKTAAITISLALDHGSRKRRLAVRLIGLLRTRFEAHAQLRDGRVLTTDGTVAISATGQLDSTTLAHILRALPPTGTYELCCHPGYNDRDLDRVTTRLRAQRDTERNALLSELPNLLTRPNAPTLLHYGTLVAEQDASFQRQV